MSKKVAVKKKAPQADNGTPAPAPPPQDARIISQLRVREIVGADKTGAEANKKYSPRTEGHVSSLSEVLEFFGYSRVDVANLVRRCHHDDSQIQVAVANIIEDRVNHEQTSFAEVKTKKQVKEEKKLQEEEAKLEAELLEKERKQVEKEAEKQQREYERAARAAAGHKSGGWDSGGWGEDSYGHEEVSGSTAALPPDPAILFAGSKAAAGAYSAGTGSGANWEAGTGEWGLKGGENDDDWWEKGKKDNWWEKGTEQWGNSNSKGGDDWEKGKGEDWWGGAADDGYWEQTSKPSGRNKGGGGGGAGAVAGGGAASAGDGGGWEEQRSGKKKKQDKDKDRQQKVEKMAVEEKEQCPPEEIWDMPENPSEAVQGGLDQWTLGDIRAAEHRREVVAMEVPPTEAPSAPPVPMSRGAPGEAFGVPPTAPPPERPEKPRKEGRDGGRDGGRERQPKQDGGGRDGGGHDGGGREGGKGKGKGEKSEPRVRNRDKPENQQDGRPGQHQDGDRGDRDREKQDRLERIDRSDDPRRQPMEEVGENVTVKKHSSMGCAVVSLKDPRVKEAILALGDITIGSIKVQVRRHMDKETKIEVPTDIFVAWGRQVEKTTPLSERELTKYFDGEHQKYNATAVAEAEERQRQAEEQARAQKLLEEQQRQQAELRDREEQRRQYEQSMRRQHEEQLRLVEEQRRKMAEAKYFGEAATQNPYGGSIGGTLTAAAAVDPRAQVGVAQASAQVHAAADPMAGVPAMGQQAAAAAGYPQQAAAAQWGAQQQQAWIQAMAYQQQQAQAQGHQAWTQQMAAAAQQRAMLGAAAGMAPQAGGPMQGLQGMAPQQAQAYYQAAYMAEAQQRGLQSACGGQGAAAAFANAQAHAQAQAAQQAAQAQQGAYAQQGAGFTYGGGAPGGGGPAPYGRGGERI